MEFVVEDALPLRGDTPAARVTTGGGTPWSMATVVFKSGVQVPPALSTSPASLAFSATAGGAIAGGQDDHDRERRWRVDGLDGVGERELVERVAGERHERGHDDGDAVDHGPERRDLHDGRHVTAAGVAGSPKTIPVTFTVDPPAPPVLAVTPTTPLILGDRGRGVTGGEDVRGVKHGQRVDGLDGVGEREPG